MPEAFREPQPASQSDCLAVQLSGTTPPAVGGDPFALPIRVELHDVVDDCLDEVQRPHLHELIDSLRNPDLLRETLASMRTIQRYVRDRPG